MANKSTTWMFFLFTTASGIIIFSSGLTSALRNDVHTTSHYIEQYGGLIALAGIAFIVVCSWCYQLHVRIEKLERLIEAQQVTQAE